MYVNVHKVLEESKHDKCIEKYFHNNNSSTGGLTSHS